MVSSAIPSLFTVSGLFREQRISGYNPLDMFYIVADVNGDSYDDIVIRGALYPHNEPALGPQPGLVLINDQKGQFYAVGGDATSSIHPREYAIADFNGDGRSDIFVADHGYDSQPFPGYRNQLLFQDADGSFADASARLPNVVDFTHSTAATDVDGDGDMDIYVGNIYGQQLIDPYFLINDGFGNFSLDRTRLPTSIATGVSGNMRQSLAVEFTDTNGDGKIDLVLGDYVSGGSSVFANNGEGFFDDSLRTNLSTISRGGTEFSLVYDIKSADLNEDGLMDLVLIATTPSFQGWAVQLLMGSSGGSFTDGTAQIGGADSYSTTGNAILFLELEDINADGALDVSMFWGEPDAVALLLNDGSGGFTGVTRGELGAFNEFLGRMNLLAVNEPTITRFVEIFPVQSDIIVRTIDVGVPRQLLWYREKSDVEMVAATYQFFTSSVPAAEGFQYLVASAMNPNDLSDEYYAQFNSENRFINFASNLGTAGEGAAAFRSLFGPLSFEQTIKSAYNEITGAALTGGALNFFLDAESFYAAVAAERVARQDVGLDEATKIVAIGSILHEAIKLGVGAYADAVEALVADVLPDGQSTLLGADLFATN